MENEQIYLLNKDVYLYELDGKKILVNVHEFAFWYGKNCKDKPEFIAKMEYGKMKLLQFEKVKLSVKGIKQHGKCQ